MDDDTREHLCVTLGVFMMGPAHEAVFTSSWAAYSVLLKHSKLLGPNPSDSTSKKLCGLLKLQDTQHRDKAVPTHSAGALEFQPCHIQPD